MSSLDVHCSFNLDHSLYRTLVHSVLLVSVPLNVFTTYLIIFQSTKSMGVYKWHLLPYHIITSLADFVSSSAAIVPFLPFPIINAAGIFTGSGISTMWQFMIEADLVMTSFFSCLSLLFYRMQKIIPQTHILSFRGTPYLIIVQSLFFFPAIVVILAAVCLQFLQTSQDILVQDFILKHGCYKLVTELTNFYIFDVDNSVMKVVFPVGFFCVALFLPCIVALVGSSFYYLHNGTTVATHVSDRTRRMQRKLMIHLMFQLIIPFCFVSPHILGTLIIINLRIPGTQALGEILFLMSTLHGTFSSISIILFNSSYFNFVKNGFRKYAVTPKLEHHIPTTRLSLK